MNRHSIARLLLATMVILGATTVPLSAQSVAYTGATIETMGAAGRLETGTIIVRDEKIVAVGKDVKIPDDARIVSLTGKTVIPGLIDPYFVFKRNSSGATQTITFRGRRITIAGRGGGAFNVGSFVNISEYFYPYGFDFKPGVRSGITVANLISDGRGLSAFANLTTKPSPEMLFQSEGYLFAKITNRTSALDIIRKPLSPATTKKRPTTRPGTPSRGATEDKTKVHWDAVRDGKKPLFVNVNNAAAAAYVLSFIKKHEKVRLVLVANGPNVFQAIDDLKANGNVTVVLQPGLDRVPFKSDLMNVSKMLQEADVPFAISMSLTNSQLIASQDEPMFPLAMLVKTGLDRETALKAVTIKPAQLMGIDKSHGSIEKGKFANFLVFDGDPLQTGSRLQQVFVNGKKIHEN